MDGNKDEALRCINIAKDAIASGNKQRALKFIGIARRLNHALHVDDLLAKCENLDSSSSSGPSNNVSNANGLKDKMRRVNSNEVQNGERNYTEEHVQLIRQIKSKMDYYAVLGVEKRCSMEDIRKAYPKDKTS
ncbi:chaperone protein dnaJ 49-like [Olea europaea var. sylvestris]|uniref:chaperone protein dnaJ 49-like n=1 Tax=Olea europaea var. sylvestris TaxID=158386 RepID=UPI000C1D6228|nr:chaperone protein dnaJ 49-like [Olea europaea var. sylvestris]